MEVKQIYEIVNAATQEAIGGSAILNEDLSNIVDIGDAVLNARSLDKYVAALVDHIGRVIFVDRPYQADAPSVLRDGWEYGAVLEKIASDMPEAVENDSWNLEDGENYIQDTFIRPVVYAKFFSKKTSFEIDRSIADRQAKSGFSGAAQLDGFISMLFNEVDKSASVKTAELIRRTINNFSAETIHAMIEAGGTLTGAGDTRAINLLARYNAQYTKTLAAADCLYDADFIRYAVFTMNIYRARMRSMSRLFNLGKKARFTPTEMLNFVMLADFKSAADVFLQSGTFNEQYTALPNAETVPYWQGSGTGYSFTDISALNVKTVSGDNVEAGGILGVLFDREALGVLNPDRRVTTHYNAKAEFTNYFYKFDSSFYNDMNQNFIVFYAA